MARSAEAPLLVNHRLPVLSLAPGENEPATRARIGQALEGLINLLGRSHLAMLALMSRLPAGPTQRLLRALASQSTTLLTSHRRIRGRRLRAVTRVLPQPPLQLLDPLTQLTVFRPQPNVLSLKLNLTR